MDCYTNNFSGLPRLKNIVADKHEITVLPLVPFVIINLTSLTAGVCMKVRFKSKVTRVFLSRCFETRIRRFAALSHGEKSIFRFEIPGILCDEWNSIFRLVGLTNPRSSGSKFRAKIRAQTEGSFTFVYLLWGCSTTLKLK